MPTKSFLLIACITGCLHADTYRIVDTGQNTCYDNRRAIPPPAEGNAYAGQDAQYSGHQPSYEINRDGTATDLVTGLMWTRDPGSKRTFEQALKGAGTCKTGGHSDWRLPSIKELYSLVQFNGVDPDPRSGSPEDLTPFIDTRVFHFSYGDLSRGERIIDSQFASATRYVHTTMMRDETVFGVNFADGRIKGYGLRDPRGGPKTFYVLYVRENPDYGQNRFVDNRNGTITDHATGLTWMEEDSKRGMNWEKALAYAEGLTLAGASDWRLPNAKELQSIVDYSRSPDTTQSAAIDPIFTCTTIRNEVGKKDYPQYWTSTSHGNLHRADTAVYFAFGRCLGFMRFPWQRETTLLDVHGAGSQRSDPKAGDAANFPEGRGPQGDVIRINNFVRCVRGGLKKP